MFIRLHFEHQWRNSYETHGNSAIGNHPVFELPVAPCNIDMAAVWTSQLQTTLVSYYKVVGIAIRYGLDGPGIKSRWGARIPAHVQTWPAAHSPSYTIGNGSLSRKLSSRGVALTTHPPPSSTDVKERVELYLYYPSGTSWHVLGWPLPLLASYCVRLGLFYVRIRLFTEGLTNMRPSTKVLAALGQQNNFSDKIQQT